MQKSLKNIFLDVFVNAGLTSDEYKIIKSDVLYKNVQTLQLGSIATSIIFVLLYITSIFSESFASNRDIYEIMSVYSILIMFVSLKKLRSKPALILPVYYMFFFGIYIFAIFLGTFCSMDMSATTFCAFLLALPLVLLDRPYRMNTMIIVVTVIFWLTAREVKSDRLFISDFENSICYMFAAIIINTIYARTRHREVYQRNIIIKEKDTDDLTKLLNKAAVEREITSYIESSKEDAMFVFIDIDNFKQINDTYGHLFGDTVLRTMGVCINNVFETGIKGRFGGDEFIVLVPGVSKKEIAMEKIEGLMAEMKKNLVTPDSKEEVMFSIGVARYPRDGASYLHLITNSDQALYASKNNGKNCCTFYSDVRKKSKI